MTPSWFSVGGEPRDAKSGELDEPVCAIFPQSVLILGQKGILREISNGTFVQIIFICTFLSANYSQTENTLVLIHTFFACVGDPIPMVASHLL